MSAFTSLANLMLVPVPAWIALVAIAGLYAVQQVTLARRLDSHARSLGHMDRWANSVEARLEQLGQGMDAGATAPVHDRRQRQERPVDLRSLSDQQLRALLVRLVGARAS